MFILSTARSGSTLLRLTLGKIPRIVSLPESFFWRFREDFRSIDLGQAADRERVARAWVTFHRIRKWSVDHDRLRAEIEEHGTTWRRIFELSIARYVEDTVPDAAPDFIWCEKSPPHVFRRDAIRADYPDARFLHLVRDPRDVAASMKTCPWATANVYVAARVWRQAARAVTASDDTLRVSYERLVADPPSELRRICEFLGLTFDAKWFEAPTSDAVEVRNVRSGASLTPISAKYAGIWRERLSKPDRDVEVIQHVCRDAMREFGYDLAKERRDLVFRSHLALGWLGLAAQRIVDG